ncbi:MAG: cytochrome C [Cyclobacteriaceae bacterium]
MPEQEELNKIVQLASKLVNLALGLVAIIGGLLIYYAVDPNLSALQSKQESVAVYSTVEEEIKDGIHLKTGLVDGEGLMTVVNNCTNCHSSKLIIQNRMSADRWNSTIEWMQETQNLWDLGVNQEVIVKYLVTNYPPKSKGRREKLANIEWYVLGN